MLNVNSRVNMYDYKNLPQENARELLKGIEDKNSEMLVIMHQYTNYVILILGGIWAFFINSYQNSVSKILFNNSAILREQTSPSNFILNFILSDLSVILLIVIGISIITLFIWRFYAHVLDDGIAQNYKKIILLEKRLYLVRSEIPESSTLFSLVEKNPNIKEVLREKGKISYDQQTEVINKLIDSGLIGSRGHWIFDSLFFGIVTILTLTAEIVLLTDPLISSDIFGLVGVISLGFILIISAFMILLNPGNLLPFVQREPSLIQIQKIASDESPYLSISEFVRQNMGRILAAAIIIFVLIYSTYSIAYNFGRVQTQKEDGQNLDEFFQNQYTDRYKEQGAEFINNIVNKTERYPNNIDKLNRIANLITQDFSDPFWINIQDLNGEFPQRKYLFLNNSGSHYKQFINKSSIIPDFWFEKRGNVRLRTMSNNSIYWDPEWIASQHTGGCQELSVLFNATANKAGIETRIVRSDGAFDPSGHMWNEVNISGEWKFFDVQEYGIQKNTNNSSLWYGNRSEYGKIIPIESPCDLTKYGVYVLDNQQNGYSEPPITDAYDPNNQCFHGTRKI